jgi:hypothetical protein
MPKGTHTAEDVRDVELIVNGSAVTVPKSPAKAWRGWQPDHQHPIRG